MRLWHRFYNNRYLLGIIGILGLFFLLVWRNPFSERTLIPNFEPFPDSFHYIVPVRSFLQGHGFFFYREGGGTFSTSVPPLYSLALLPLYLFVSDPRAFYFTNVFLALVSFFLFERILSRAVVSQWLRLFLLAAFVIATPFTWVPTLAMAENLLLPLFLSAILLLLLPITSKTTILAGILSWALYGTKYAAGPQTALFFLLYMAKIWRELAGSQRWKFLRNFVLTSVLSAGVIFLFEQLHKGRNPVTTALYLVAAWFSPTTASNDGTPGLKSFFSWEFMLQHWLQYFAGIFGNAQRFLWRQTQLLPQGVAIFGGVGIVVHMLRARLKQGRWLAAALFLFIVGQGTFMSTFYDVDLRFVYITFPLVLLGFGWFFEWVWQQFPRQKWLPMSTICLLFFVLLAQNAINVKQQIGLNLRHAETPWYYISVKNLNAYFDTHEFADEKPVVISPMDPYLIDFYANGKYTLLPLSEEQNVNRNHWPKIWGDHDYTDFVALYTQQLESGKMVFVMKYGLGNEHALHDDFKRLQDNFELILVQEGCYTLCDIYQVKLKTENLE